MDYISDNDGTVTHHDIMTHFMPKGLFYADFLYPTRRRILRRTIAPFKMTKKGLVECYIYTKNIRIISELKMGKTKIDITGKFSRFFSMLDEYYTKIEIIDASISIHEPEKKKEVKEKTKTKEKK